MKSMPVFFGFFFVLFDEIIVFLFLFFKLLGGFQFQRIGAQHRQNGAALVATDGIALVDVFLVHVDDTVTIRALDPVVDCHRQYPPEILLIAECAPPLQGESLDRTDYFEACVL
jgi:hypothetical protein